VVMVMKSVVEDISPVKKKIRIDVDAADMAREMNKAFSEVSKKAKIPGFRPGKAPRAVVERHYGEDVKSDVINKLISSSFLAAVGEHKIIPVEMPAISDVVMDKTTPLSFTATVEIRPNINLGTYDGIEIQEQAISVTEEELTQTIDRLREMYAELTVVEGRPLENQDTAVMDFEGFKDGKSISGAKASDYMLALGSNSLIPGFEEQMVGMAKGDTRELKVTFPADYDNKDLAGQPVTFTVTLKEIKKKVLPALNEEFAKDLGGKSLDDLKEGIKKDLEARKKDEQNAAQREAILSKLVDSHSFDVPTGMVQHELQAMARQKATRMAKQGRDVKTFDINQFNEENQALAEKRVKGVLILDEIADKEKVDVTEQEISGALAMMAKTSGQPVDVIKKYYETQDGGLDNLRSSLIQEKTLGLLLSRSKKSYN